MHKQVLNHATSVVCLTLTVKVLELAIICNATCLSAHLEPAFMYKGEVCTGKFVFIRARPKGKARLHAVYNS